MGLFETSLAGGLLTTAYLLLFVAIIGRSPEGQYQSSSCQQLAQEKSQPPAGEKVQMLQRTVQMLRNDPRMHSAFIDQVAAPIAN